ncbi:hypothetical protein ABZ943_40250, partial [Streptomyces rubiginosohelvolus]
SGLGARFLHTHWLDTVVLLLPLLRPLRMVKVSRSSVWTRPGPDARLPAHAPTDVPATVTAPVRFRRWLRPTALPGSGNGRTRPTAGVSAPATPVR